LLALVGGCGIDFVLFNGQPLDGYGFDAFDGEMLDREALDFLGPLDPSAIREIEIPSGGETLAAVLVAESDPTPDDTLIVFFHGSSRHLDYYWARVRLLHATGLPVLAIDYRGYGKSTGSSNVPNVLEDARAAMRYAQEVHQVTGVRGRIVRVPGGHDAVPGDLGYDVFLGTVADFVEGL
jgi:pimeloyl-ACP methyl ester carboxylesterase